MARISLGMTAGILFLLAISAWPKGFYLEGAGGVNISQAATTQDYTSFNTLDLGSKVMRKGFNGGIGLGYRGYGSFGFVTGLYYENKGNRGLYEEEITTGYGRVTNTIDVTWDFDYITIPLLGEATIPLKPGNLFIRLGIGFNYLQKATTSQTLNGQSFSEYINTQYTQLDQAYSYGLITDNDYLSYAWSFENALRQDTVANSLAFNKYDANLIGGLGYEYTIGNIGLFIRAQFSYGLMEIQKTQYLEQLDYSFYPYSQKISGSIKNISGNVNVGVRKYF